jgi:peroxin-2
MRADRNRYRTLVDRLLGMNLTPVTRIANRNVSYEFMNRQMVWHTFMVCLFFFVYSNSYSLL